MRLGISLSSRYAGDPRSGPRQAIERARLAHQVGLDSLSLGDHHNMAVPYLQNVPMIGRLLAEWPERPAGCLFLLPLWHPLLAAEQIGTLAAIHSDRFIVQTGLGYGADQFEAFGRSESTRGAVVEQSIGIVQALLAGETVDVPQFDSVGCRVGHLPPEPVEWWVGSGAVVGVERAARFGASWYASPRVTPTADVALIDAYQSACAASGTEPRMVVRRDALVLADAAEAHRLGAAMVSKGYRGLQAEQLLLGGVDEVADDLRKLADAGFGEVIVRCMSGDQAVALETIEMMGEVRRGLCQ